MSRFDFSSRYARKSDGDFILAAGRAFYVDYWSRMGADESGNGGNGDKVPGGCDLLDYAPQTQRWALKLARQFAADLERIYGCTLPHLLEQWQACAETADHADRDATESNLGFYAAMQAMGHGVGLEDCGVEISNRSLFPYLEAYPR